MRNFIRKWLGIETIDDLQMYDRKIILNLDKRMEAIEKDFNSRDTCKVCGKHRYNSSQCLLQTGD